MVMTTMLIASIVSLMLLVILLIVFIACKPWRYFSSIVHRFHRIPFKADDLERPLVTDDVQIENPSDEPTINYGLEGSCVQTENYLQSPRTEGLVHKLRLPPVPAYSVKGDSVVLDVIAHCREDVVLGQTLKRPPDHIAEVPRHGIKEDSSRSVYSGVENEIVQEFVPKTGSCLTLEVISGPSSGLLYYVQSITASKLPLTLGRVAPSDLQLKDSEVSGKHAMINWNSNKMKWELIDMGSLNGTLLNSHPINRPDTARRRWGDPVELGSGDVITIGTTSKISVLITSETESEIPFGVGMASDPMAQRRGGKKLPMEDVCYYQWPLPGVDQFGLFGICDGHMGKGAAESASKILPEMVASILVDSLKRQRVLTNCDAKDVLVEAFIKTEARLNHFYEGCTATVLLIWADGSNNFFVQCANVGDSACIVHVGGKQVTLTEDHRVTSYSERLRIQEVGEPLRDGESRLYGLNLARMLGDKYLKEQDARFSSEPYVSQVVHINQASRAFAVMASDGLWDVISAKRAFQLVLQAKDRISTESESSAEKIANLLLTEARTLRTKDNTSIIFLDFDSKVCKVDL